MFLPEVLPCVSFFEVACLQRLLRTQNKSPSLSVWGRTASEKRLTNNVVNQSVMKIKQFSKVKKVLVFNKNGKLLVISSSLQAASQAVLVHPQSIFFCCTGKYRMAGGFYFRYLNPDVPVGIGDMEHLRLETYDRACGVEWEHKKKRPSRRMMAYWHRRRAERLSRREEGGE